MVEVGKWAGVLAGGLVVAGGGAALTGKTYDEFSYDLPHALSDDDPTPSWDGRKYVAGGFGGAALGLVGASASGVAAAKLLADAKPLVRNGAGAVVGAAVLAAYVGGTLAVAGHLLNQRQE